MAYMMTFSSLQEDIRRYVERGFTAESDPIVYDQIPRLITMAERRIARELKVQGFIRASTLRRRIDAEDWSGAKAECMKWTRGGGRVLPGLVKRRSAEAGLLMK